VHDELDRKGKNNKDEAERRLRKLNPDWEGGESKKEGGASSKLEKPRARRLRYFSQRVLAWSPEKKGTESRRRGGEELKITRSQFL